MGTDTGTRFDVAPSEADWYYCAIVDRAGETDYIDGYAKGERPSARSFRKHTGWKGPILAWESRATPHGEHAGRPRVKWAR
jgi:hypothetical protein